MAPRRSIRRRWFVAAGLLVLLWLGSPWGIQHRNRLSRCPSCGSTRWEEDWRLFSPEGPRILPREDRVDAGMALNDFGDDGHAHLWLGLHGQTSRGPLSVHWTGVGTGNGLVSAYEREEAFRRWLGAAVRDGTLAKREALILLGIPAYRWFFRTPPAALKRDLGLDPALRQAPGFPSEEEVRRVAGKGREALAGAEFPFRGRLEEFLAEF
ncbi:MAG: hypothetical protein HUU06_06285 [Planctomycetaceae bacterium]|nr:hypothetical protein [Planctomycetota bacterium]NUN52380.1 hypothetical protein [Planctomycetaceae bacterium]